MGAPLYWTVNSFLSMPGLQGCSFEVWATEHFVDLTRQALKDVNIKGVVEQMKYMALEVGIKTIDVRFDDRGLKQVFFTGLNGKGLRREDQNTFSLCLGGATYGTHNIDCPAHQSLLMAIWVMWANIVISYEP